MTTNPEIHTCPDCSYTWQHVQHGGHSCAIHLTAQLERLRIAGEQMVFSLCHVSPALFELHGPRHDLRALIDSVRCGLEHAITADPTWCETAASEGVTLSDGNVWIARPTSPPVQLNNIPASPEWSALHSLAKLAADANEYCQQIGLGKWGESATAALIADHKRLSQVSQSAEDCTEAGAQPLTCECGDSYPSGSYGAGFIEGRGHCPNCAAGAGEMASLLGVSPAPVVNQQMTTEPGPVAPLAPKHQGMRISAAGMLNRVGGRLQFGAREMLKHLEEMADRYYAGDIAVVDEFLQMYCLDEKRPEQQTEGAQR